MRFFLKRAFRAIKTRKVPIHIHIMTYMKGTIASNESDPMVSRSQDFHSLYSRYG